MNLQIIIAPVKVQGEEAKTDIVKAIQFVNLYIKDIDVIILARGGGSLEDLQPFNEEIVARAIFQSKIPIISAVGHETDFTIADFTADLRAPTPSAAAELVVKNKEDLLLHLSNLEKQLISNILKIFNYNKQLFLTYEKKLYSKFIEVKAMKNRVFNLENSLIKYIFAKASNEKKRFAELNEQLKFNNPEVKIEKIKNRVFQLSEAMVNCINKKVYENRQKIRYFENTLNNLNPFNVLSRGYSITFKNGKPVTSAKEVYLNDEIDVLLYKGELKALVSKIGGEK